MASNGKLWYSQTMYHQQSNHNNLYINICYPKAYMFFYFLTFIFTQSDLPVEEVQLLSRLFQKYGKIDVVVSNAAVNPTVDPLLQTQESILDKLWETNVKATVLLLQEAAPHLQKGSSVVLISSIAGFHPQAAMAMYGVTKTALLGLTKALAVEMAPDTRVNCVAPGFVPTYFAAYITKDEVVRKAAEDQTLLQRLGTPEDMAAATAFLASDDASYITGENLVVAGGIPSRL